MATLPYWMQQRFAGMMDPQQVSSAMGQGYFTQAGLGDMAPPTAYQPQVTSVAGGSPYMPGTGYTGGSAGGYQPGSAPGYGTSTDPENAGFNLFGDARAWLAANPQIWNPYGGQMVAGQNATQGQATDAVTNMLGYQPQNVSGGSFLSGDLSAYQNPYTQQVIDASLSDIDRSRQIANQQGARSAGASTYGGDRNALIEAETNRGYADIAARTSAQLRSQGFDTAAGLMGQDLSRGLTAGLANQQAGLAGAQLGLGAAGQLYGMGTQQQATEQAGLDAQYNEYLRSNFGPLQGYNFLAGMLPGYGQYNPQGSNRGAGVAGGALSGAAVGAQFGPWGAGIGAVGGGLMGLFG